MRHILLFATLLSTLAAGCKSDPYCLNCTDGANGDGGGNMKPDLSGPDLAGQDLLPPVDMAGGPCVPTNGGVEKCDGVDNDCNGTVDDVDPSKLLNDPNNCGSCGNVCNFNSIHRFATCAGGGDAGAAHCVPTTCQAGYVNIDPNDPGCSYQCTPTSDPTEICDGKDNDCNGKIDDPFTTTWAADGKPNYDKLTADCGGCGITCNLPGAVNACTKSATTGKGVCTVDHCINDGTKTFRHDPTAGDLNTTGCEYQCPFPSTTVTTGSQDCDNTTCAFPPELCNGFDDNCNFLIDDPPFAAAENIGGNCADKCPNGNCLGQCKPGVVTCSNGVKVCVGGTGPTPETCDGVDNDCNGKIDDPFTKGYDSNNLPLYNSDVANCGACGTTCGLAHATNTCVSDTSIDATGHGVCEVLACNSGYAYATKAACGGSTAGPENGPTGVGCYYQCPVYPTTPELCNGKDDNCDGCVDENLVAPSLGCVTDKGVCLTGASLIKVTCGGTSGWKCDYSKVPNIELDANGNLRATELRCDGLDGNCSGGTPDIDGFPTKGQTCSAGQGVCQRFGTLQCQTISALGCLDASQQVVTSDDTKRTDELCDGKDNDCDGLIDERTDSVVNGTTYKGWRDQMEVVNGVYVYSFEASRPDSSLTSPGSISTRSCAKKGVQPWVNVSRSQAAAACASVKDSAGQPMRLCSDIEWQNACVGPLPANTPLSYSESSNATTYTSGVCNDLNANIGKAWETGHDNGNATKCYTPVGNGLYDMSGNVMEWTSSTVTAGGTTYYKIRGGAYNTLADGVSPDGTSCQFDFVIAQDSFVNANVGFRCCAANAP